MIFYVANTRMHLFVKRVIRGGTTFSSIGLCRRSLYFLSFLIGQSFLRRHSFIVRFYRRLSVASCDFCFVYIYIYLAQSGKVDHYLGQTADGR